MESVGRHKLYARTLPSPNFRMYYVYVLKNRITNRLYYGYTNDLDRRLRQHNSKEEWRIVYYEAYLAESDARERERKLKYYGQTRSCLKSRLKQSLTQEN